MVNFAEKFKLSPKFFLFPVKLHFLADIATILWAKICVIDCYLTLVQYVAFAPKIQKNGGKNFY